MHIHALGLQALAKGVPVGERWEQYDAVSVRETCADVPADGAVEKIVVLIELYDVVVGRGARQHLLPGLTVPHSVHLSFKLRVHGSSRSRL